MMGWFFRWWMRGMQKANNDTSVEMRAVHAVSAARNFEGGIMFQVVEAQNGKILKVQVPSGGNSNSKGAYGGFNPHNGMEEKLWIVPEGENVIEFVTRALVEERIK